jgi:hypothetical protein
MTNEKPKLLHELRWRRIKTPDGPMRRALMGSYQVVEGAGGTYTIVTTESNPIAGDKPCGCTEDLVPVYGWCDLDPITAQAVLIHLQQPTDDVAESDQPTT